VENKFSQASSLSQKKKIIVIDDCTKDFNLELMMEVLKHLNQWIEGKFLISQ